MKIKLIQNNFFVIAELISSNPQVIKIKEIEFQSDIVQISENLFSIIINNKSWFLSYNEQDSKIHLSDSNGENLITIQNELEMKMDDFGYKCLTEQKVGKIHAEIPGLIIKLFVNVGEKVKLGNHLCILEAMKMENEIYSPLNGLIKSIHVSEGSTIEKGKLIMEIEPDVVE